MRCWRPMTSHLTINGREHAVDLSAPIDISIPLRFDGPQPNAFGVEPATSQACEYGDLVGDTRRGGSCNFERVTFIPHCNGTHTECVGHITNERISVGECLRDAFVSALLISVLPQEEDGELLIERPALEDAGVDALPGSESRALIVRTLPYDDGKLSRVYDENNIPPYFTADAMNFIVECGFRHLLVDVPSIDRLFDDGKLMNHRIFWNVEQGSFEVNHATRVNSTITELIYVASTVADGEYLLNLQIAPFESDAAPSRPVLFRSEPLA
jgi:arylformamidase